MGLEKLILGIENLIYLNATDSLLKSANQRASSSFRGALIQNDEIFNAGDQLFQAHWQWFCAQLIKRTE